MATLHEIKQHLGLTSDRTFTAKLYYDPKSDNANAYVKIDTHGDFVFAFDRVSEPECSSKYVRYNKEFVTGIRADLFMPFGTVEEFDTGATHWQLDIYMDNGEGAQLFMPRFNHKIKGLQGTTESRDIGDILKDKKQNVPYTVGGWK